MTQLESARKGRITPGMRAVAKAESVSPEFILEGVSRGHIVIAANQKKRIKPCGIGKGLSTKVNANIGTSPARTSLRYELKKLAAAVNSGADTVMDLSTGGDIRRIRKEIIRKSCIPVGTVPVYEAVVSNSRDKKTLAAMKAGDFIDVVEAHAREGVDFMTIHCGVTRKVLGVLKTQHRLMKIVSRGGALVAEWMHLTGHENPYYEHFGRIIEIAREFDVTLSLGDGMRPGAISDATDAPQIEELMVLGQLSQRTRDAGVQVIIEGPGHLPLDEIEANVRLQKKLAGGAPFYVLGPIVTDVAAGYDHITGAIGGAIAAWHGADYLCYVTPSEHLRLPDIDDVREGVIASRIAAHAADLVKGIRKAADWDIQMSAARNKRDWKKQIRLSIDPDRAARLKASSQASTEDVCTMCGEYCALKVSEHAGV